MTCGQFEIEGCVQSSPAGTPIAAAGTVIYGGSSTGVNPSMAALGLFGNLSATATLTIVFRSGGVSGVEVAQYGVGPLETRAWTVLGFDTIVASATAPVLLTYTMQLKTRE